MQRSSDLLAGICPPFYLSHFQKAVSTTVRGSSGRRHKAPVYKAEKQRETPPSDQNTRLDTDFSNLKVRTLTKQIRVTEVARIFHWHFSQTAAYLISSLHAFFSRMLTSLSAINLKRLLAVAAYFHTDGILLAGATGQGPKCRQNLHQLKLKVKSV